MILRVKLDELIIKIRLVLSEQVLFLNVIEGLTRGVMKRKCRVLAQLSFFHHHVLYFQRVFVNNEARLAVVYAFEDSLNREYSFARQLRQIS